MGERKDSSADASIARTRFGLGAYLLALGFLAPLLLAWAWPAIASAPGADPAVVGGNATADATYHLHAWPTARTADVPAPTLTLLLVLLGGFIGAWLHASIKFVYKVGASRFEPAWAWWCVLVPWMGALLAAGTFAVFHGLGALVEPAVSLNVSLPPSAPFGFAFITGLFSRKATLWLEAQASRIFRGGKSGEDSGASGSAGGVRSVSVTDGAGAQPAATKKHP